MIYADIIAEIKRRLKNVTTETISAIELAINNYYFQLWNKNNWWFARREFSMDTIVPYETGTISVTQDSATVTGSGTAWTSAMKDRKLVVDSDNKAYAIKTVGSPTSITLETVYKGDTASGKSYKIYKSVYRLDDRVFKMLWIKQTYTPCVLQEFFEREFDRFLPVPYSAGDPLRYCLRGQTTSDYYNTGTVAVTNNSASVTGTNTAWDSTLVGMVFKVTGDGVEYKISSVTNATTLVLSKVYNGTTSASTTYVIGPVGTEQIEVDPLPDKIMQLKYKAIIRPLRLINNNDVPELPEQWHWLLIEGGLLNVAPGRVSDSLVQITADKVSNGEDDLMKWHGVSEDENPSILDNYRNDIIKDRRSYVFED
ncbi:MAG: hypothetical protein QME51_04215 [Planctomycetota bacterium]|nr:hypothetical protein [Planctomycetota bacterium]